MKKLILPVLILAIVGMGIYVAYGFLGHVGDVRATQTQLQEQFTASTGEGFGTAVAGALVTPPKPLPGDAVARVTIPRLNQSWIVVEGVQPGDIAYAPGHYPFTQLPGQVGNFAVAGHRSIGLFWDLDKVHQGDQITVQTKRATYTYVVTRNFITSPQSLAEVSKTPPGFQAGSKVLTLTTCEPKWDNYSRMVIHAVLQS